MEFTKKGSSLIRNDTKRPNTSYYMSNVTSQMSIFSLTDTTATTSATAAVTIVTEHPKTTSPMTFTCREKKLMVKVLRVNVIYALRLLLLGS